MAVMSAARVAGAKAPAATRMAARAASLRWRALRMMSLEALSDAEAGVRSRRPLGKIEADRPEPELRDVEAEADAGVGSIQPVVVIDHDVTELVRDGLRPADALPAVVVEQRDVELAVGRDRNAQLRLQERLLGSVEHFTVTAQLLIGQHEEFVRRNRTGRVAEEAVKAEGGVAKYREELRAVERRDRVAELRTDLRTRKLFAQGRQHAAARVEDVVSRVILQRDRHRVQVVPSAVGRVRDRGRHDTERRAVFRCSEGT